MTILESVVSGSIMVGVVVLSFQTMLTGAQISQKSTAGNDMSDDLRSAFTKLTTDIRSAESIIQGYKPTTMDCQTAVDQISLKIPKFNPSGRKIAGQWTAINYFLKPVAGPTGPHHLIRTTGDVDGAANPINVISTNLASNVKEINFDYFLKQSVSATGSTYALPGVLTFAAPTGSKVRIFEVNAPWAGLNLRDSSDSVTGNGVSLTNLITSGLTIMGSGFITSTAPPAGAKTDILMQVASNQTPDSNYLIKGNRVAVKILSERTMPDGTTKSIVLEDTAILANSN